MLTRNVFNAFLTLVFVLASLTAAQATLLPHTYVWSAGSDVNDGSRLSPCATFANAFSKTTIGGVISVIDVGEYGPITITHSITIDGTVGQRGTILNPATISAHCIDIKAGANDNVILRHLALYAAGVYQLGINFISGGSLMVDDCSFNGFGGYGILDQGTSMTVNNSKIDSASTGAGIDIISGTASVHNVTVIGGFVGITASAGQTDISNCVLTQCLGHAVECGGGSTISCEACMISSSNTGVYVFTGGIVRLSNCDLFNNTIGLSNAGGTISSAGNNKKAGNTTSGAFNGTVTVQ